MLAELKRGPKQVSGANMKKIVLMCLLATAFIATTIETPRAYAMTNGCGCGGAGPTCQTNQRLGFAVLTIVGGYFHYQVLKPIAEASNVPLLVYTAGYAIPAGAIYAAYSWWNRESK